MTNPIVETYSRLAQQYDDEFNMHSCWGRESDRALNTIHIQSSYRVVLDMGCGTGRALARLASQSGPNVRFIGVDPAKNMRKRAAERAHGAPNIQILDGSFESIPVESASVDYLYSIFAFHWTTDLDRSVRELARALKSDGEMDLFFIGRHNGREFIEKTTPIFSKYLGPKQLLASASLRKQLTPEAAFQLYSRAFDPSRLSIEESYDTYYDTLEGHWGWWVRIEGHFLQMPPDTKEACDQEVKAALESLAGERGIPYTIHQLHVKVRRA
ncbi:MAG: class I SAM-dependent methyltransferase [Candidatus Acidiferrales bacterium]|jgi:ubiquinone/menaquinone biosynthesis C-methylase UbiE